MTVTVPEKNGSLKCAPKKNTRGKSAFSPYATVTMTKKKCAREMCPRVNITGANICHPSHIVCTMTVGGPSPLGTSLVPRDLGPTDWLFLNPKAQAKPMMNQYIYSNVSVNG
jgi:hypothetical protein